METKAKSFSSSYLAALRRRVAQPSGASRPPVASKRLGRAAAKLRLTTDDLARIHIAALQQLLASHPAAKFRRPMLRRSGSFFKATSTAMEELRSPERTAAAQLESIVVVLARRTGELAASNEKLRRELLQRESVEQSLRSSEGNTSRLLAQSQRMQHELRHLSRRLISVQEEERKRISQELHDVVAQALSSINLRLALLKSRSTANTRGLQLKIATTQRLVQESVEIVHRFARDLRPTVLDDLGLIPALRSHLKHVAAETGLKLTFQCSAEVETLGLAAKTVLFRICQQALTNIVQHARARHATVQLTQRSGTVRLVIHDDGHGFQPREAAGTKKIAHLGLLGMRERAEMIGGTFSVESAPGKSTRVEVTLPANLRAGAGKRPTRKQRAR